MLMTFINSPRFSDENDNFLGAMMVTYGRDIYSHYISQHMPLAYYIFAVPAWIFKINTVPAFRIAFYIILITIWIAMYFRYRDKFGKFVLWAYPILYIFSMAFYDLHSCSAISDQFQAQGLVILFLEFLYFLQTKSIDWKVSIFVSLGIVLSFGTTFVSSLAVFVIAVAVLYVDVKDLITKKIPILKWPIYFLKKYWLLMMLVALPFLVLVVWYAVTDNLYNFYFGAYKLNTTIYSKYVGTGQNILRDIASTVSWYSNTFKGSVDSIATTGLISLKFIFFVAIHAMFCILFFKKHKEIVVFPIVFILMCGIRGFAGFHSMGYYAITFVMACILFKKYFLDKKSNQTVLAHVFVCTALASFSVQFLNGVPGMLDFRSAFKSCEYKNGSTEFLIKQLVHENEPIYVSTLDLEMYIRVNRYPVYSPSTSVPWMWEAYHEQDFYYLNQYNPKVLCHNDEYEIGGHKLKDYAPDFINYVHEHYTLLSPEYPELFVRNEFLDDARKIMSKI